MAKRLVAPSEAISEIDELDLFFNTWKKALGPIGSPSSSNGTEAWLHGFGSQTKWLTGDSWTWWIESFSPPEHIDLKTAKNFISLVIGMMGDRSPQGEAVRYARSLVGFLESGSGDSAV